MLMRVGRTCDRVPRESLRKYYGNVMLICTC